MAPDEEAAPAFGIVVLRSDGRYRMLRVDRVPLVGYRWVDDLGFPWETDDGLAWSSPLRAARGLPSTAETQEWWP
jgi:hypothetical protein